MGVGGRLRSALVKVCRAGVRRHSFIKAHDGPGRVPVHEAGSPLVSRFACTNNRVPIIENVAEIYQSRRTSLPGAVPLWKQFVDRGMSPPGKYVPLEYTRKYHGQPKSPSVLELARTYLRQPALTSSKVVGLNSRCKVGTASSVAPASQPSAVLPVLRFGTAQLGRGTTSLQAGQAIPHRRLHFNRGAQVAFRRSFGNGPEMVWGLLLANAAVFSAWQVLDPRFMAAHFMVSDENIRKGRWHTLLTSAFSHKDFSHIFTNMIGLYFFGTELCQLFGGRYLLGLYLAGGVTASICHLVYFRYIFPDLERRRGRWFVTSYNAPALGASGAVNAVVLLNCLLFPTRIIYLNLFIPVPGILLGLGFILKDLYGASNSGSSIGHAAHLGGAIVGFLAWVILRSPRL